MNLNLNSGLEKLFKMNSDNKLAYIYQIYAIIDIYIYKDSMSHEHSKQILENLIYLHTRMVKHHYLVDYIILNLDSETKKPILELGRKIEKNPIDKTDFILESHNKFCCTKDKITDDKVISKHSCNNELFEEIHYDIEYKLFGDDDDDA